MEGKKPINQLNLWDLPKDKSYMDFRKARDIARSLKLRDQEEWENYIGRWQLTNGESKKVIPLKPDIIYRDSGWKGWNDWLGLSEEENREREGKAAGNDLLFSEWTLWNAREKSEWLPFNEARQIAREYGFEYEEEWNIFVNGKLTHRTPLPVTIPKNPDQVYRFHGWKSWTDWLMSDDRRIEYTGFNKARDFARSLRIDDQAGWRPFIKVNASLSGEYNVVLPERPHLEYRDKGWESWEDWLGTKIKFHDFHSTRKFIHSLKLSSRNDWIRYCSGQLTLKSRKTENIYTYPEIAFKNEGWKGWDDWLGTSSVRKDKPVPGIPDRAVECRCRGRIEDCPDCDGKGYYFK